MAIAIPVVCVGTLRFVDPPTTAFMLRAQADGPVRQRWLPLDQIAPELALAVVASEDQRFPVHWGFDLDAIADAVVERARGERLRGASTISQQVAKNLFLWPGRSLVRKGLEAWLVLFIEALWPKQRILEVYLNVAQFGPDVFGAGEASLRYFGVPARLLLPSEAALLAAALPSPERFDPDAPAEHLRERRDWILEQMEHLGGPAYLRLGASR